MWIAFSVAQSLATFLFNSKVKIRVCLKRQDRKDAWFEDAAIDSAAPTR